MTTLRWLTAGESHGPRLTAILEGIPSGLMLDEEMIARELSRRQQGHGRGGRMKIERDAARIDGGVRHGRTLGGPIALSIENRDFANWSTRMKVAPLAAGEEAGAPVVLPRPGHADLAGGLKYGASDLRDVLERASARETAARVALGAVAKALLASVDIHVGSQVRSIHSVQAPEALALVPEAAFDARLLSAVSDASVVRCADAAASERMVAAIDEARRRRDTVGGAFEVLVSGVPVGLGSHVHWDRRLDARLVRALVAIPAIKAAEVGDGWAAAERFGSEVHDAIVRHGPSLERPTNRAGGIEGGISNGSCIVVRAAMKPIATVPAALPSVNLATGEVETAHIERSDSCAVPAAAVIGEAMVALTIAEALLEAFGADTIESLQAAVRGAWRRSRRLPGHLYLCGLPGAGKSTVGALVAQATGRPFIDLDAEIRDATGKSPAELFALEGEAGFRHHEAEALRQAMNAPPSIVSLGGGSLTVPVIRDAVRRSGDLVWLDVPAEVAAARLAGDRSRPLLGDDPITALRTLQLAREPTFRASADARVDADADAARVAERVVGATGALR